MPRQVIQGDAAMAAADDQQTRIGVGEVGGIIVAEVVGRQGDATAIRERVGYAACPQCIGFAMPAAPAQGHFTTADAGRIGNADRKIALEGKKGSARAESSGRAQNTKITTYPPIES